MYLSLEHLRAIADSMHEGYLYLLNLWAYMALFEGADVSRSTIQSELAGLVINQKCDAFASRFFENQPNIIAASTGDVGRAYSG